MTSIASAKHESAERCHMLLVAYWFLLFLPHYTLQQQQQQEDTLKEPVCPCQRDNAMELMAEVVLHDSVKEGQTRMLWCCADLLLKRPAALTAAGGSTDPDVRITWSFKGEQYPWKQSSFKTHQCGEEVLVTRSASRTDEGNYTCVVTASDGTTITRSVDLSVYKNTVYRDVPTDIHSSGNLTRPLGAKNVIFTCEGYVGDKAYFPFNWMQVDSRGNIFSASQLPNVTVLKPVGHEKLKSQLVIAEVSEEHYGVYICTVRNTYGSEIINMTLTEGVPEEEAREEKYRGLVVVAAGVLVVVGVSVFVWLRCGLHIWLCLRHAFASPTSEAGHVDILVVHGDSATHWVGSVLLPVLEHTYHYTCFLPHRDMLAGDQVAESILGVLSRCRRVVVVVTPCLLDSSWATWSAYSGIQAALTTPARILALVLQEPEMKIGTHEKNSLLEVLRVVRKVRVPLECGWQVANEDQELNNMEEDFFMAGVETTTENHFQLTEGYTKSFFYHGSGDIIVDKKSDDKLNSTTAAADTNGDETPRLNIKLSLPELTQLPGSHSPGSQRLSNMVSASGAASRESLEPNNKKAVAPTEETLTFTQENEDNNYPGSPCSITPFIITPPQPSCKTQCSPSSQDSVCRSMGRCIQAVCVGNPEQVFWQTVRLHLGPPSVPAVQQ